MVESNSIELTCSYDPWLEEKDRTVWMVRLSDGSEVWMDDDRYKDPAWIRLARHLKQEKLQIKEMWLRFRDHWEFVGANKKGWYFVPGIIKDIMSQKKVGFYIAGYLEKNKIKCYKWRVPELILMDEFDRSIDGAGERDGVSYLIRN